jgi:hypothetical protein
MACPDTNIYRWLLMFINNGADKKLNSDVNFFLIYNGMEIYWIYGTNR